MAFLKLFMKKVNDEPINIRKFDKDECCDSVNALKALISQNFGNCFGILVYH